MGIFKKGFLEILSSQMVSLVIGLIAGTILAIFKDNIFLVPGMLILLPGFLEMRGNISGSLAARLSSGLYLGFIKPNRNNTRILRGNLIASFFLVIIISLTLGIIAFLFTFLVFRLFFPKIILISLLAALITNFIEIPLTIFFTFYFFKKGYDPDNIMGPFITSTGDLTCILSLLIVMIIL